MDGVYRNKDEVVVPGGVSTVIMGEDAKPKLTAGEGKQEEASG